MLQEDFLDVNYDVQRDPAQRRSAAIS